MAIRKSNKGVENKNSVAKRIHRMSIINSQHIPQQERKITRKQKQKDPRTTSPEPRETNNTFMRFFLLQTNKAFCFIPMAKKFCKPQNYIWFGKPRRASNTDECVVLNQLLKSGSSIAAMEEMNGARYPIQHTHITPKNQQKTYKRFS